MWAYTPDKSPAYNAMWDDVLPNTADKKKNLKAAVVREHKITSCGAAVSHMSCHTGGMKEEITGNRGGCRSFLTTPDSWGAGQLSSHAAKTLRQTTFRPQRHMTHQQHQELLRKMLFVARHLYMQNALGEMFSHGQEMPEDCGLWVLLPLRCSGIFRRLIHQKGSKVTCNTWKKRGNCIYSGRCWGQPVVSAQGGKKDWCGKEGGDGRRAGRKGDIVNFPRILQGCETASTTLTFVEVQMCASHWLFMWYFLFHSMEHSARPMQSCPMRFIGFKRRWVYIELYKRMTCLYGCMIPFHVSS